MKRRKKEDVLPIRRSAHGS